MQNNFDEEIFDAVLQRVFCDYTDEQIASYPDCAELSKKYPLPKKEKRAFDRAAEETKYNKSLVRVYLSRAAVIFLCIITLAAGVMLSSSQVRAAVKNVFVEWFDRYARFSFVSTDTSVNDFESIEDVEIGYVPDEYELIGTDGIDGEIAYIYSLNNSNDYMYMVEVFENGAVELFPDNNYSEYTKLQINGRDAWIIYDNDNGSGTLILVGAKISVSISGYLPKKELIKIAESLK